MVIFPVFQIPESRSAQSWSSNYYSSTRTSYPPKKSPCLAEIQKISVSIRNTLEVVFSNLHSKALYLTFSSSLSDPVIPIESVAYVYPAKRPWLEVQATPETIATSNLK